MISRLNEIRPVWLEIDLDNLEYNFKAIRKMVHKDTIIMPVVKANGYGHGSVEVARLYKKNGADRIAVSILTEALELRKAGIDLPIQLLSFTPKEQLGTVVDYDIIQGIYTFEDASELSKVSLERNKVSKIHIKIDTGMGRIGFSPNSFSIKEIVKISKLPNIEIEGIFTHFAKADEADKEYTKLQYDRFDSVVGKLAEKNINIKIKHVSNSAAILDLPQYNLDMVRPGIMLYGYYPSQEVDKTTIQLKPAMTLKARVSNVKLVEEDTGISYGHIFSTLKPSIIATIPIGYADGYSRMLSGKSSVYIKGKRVPIVGRICMDQMMIDVTEIEDVQIGDEVILFGAEKKDYPQVEELASILGTINYELICMMGRRIPRVYLKDKQILSFRDYLID